MYTLLKVRPTEGIIMTIEIAAFITALGHATNIAKALVYERDEAKRNAAYSELIGALADTKTQYLAIVEDKQKLLESNEDLKKRIAEYDKWEHEKTRYSLQNVGAGVVVYVLDPDKARGEALHWLCTHCYENRKKGFLHRHGKIPNHYKCDGCGSEIDAIKRYPSAA